VIPNKNSIKRGTFLRTSCTIVLKLFFKTDFSFFVKPFKCQMTGMHDMKTRYCTVPGQKEATEIEK